LERIGFQVIRAANVTRQDMNQKLREFAGKIGPGDTAFFYYAGHSVEISNTNYLLAVDVPPADKADAPLITREGIAADSIVESILNRGAKVSIIVLDACRDNPYKTPGSRGIGGTRGLAQMTAPEGVFVLYSAGLGQAALDRLSDADRNPNSVFTRSFVRLLTTPGLSVQELAKQTQVEVRELAQSANHQQMPAYYDQILGPFTLVPASKQLPGQLVNPK
jgi:hypothetical protein